MFLKTDIMKSDFEKARIGLSLVFLVVAIIANLVIWFKWGFSNLFWWSYNYIFITMCIIGFITSISGIIKAIHTENDDDAEIYVKLSYVGTAIFLYSHLLALSLIN